MNHPRRVRSPPFGFDPRVIGRPDPRPPPEYDDMYGPATPFEPMPPGFLESHPQCPINYRDHRLPSTYRATLREPYLAAGSAPYKILCITNINHKISDGAIREALINDFNRFGEISVSICHDSGERLAYIYFRTYEEAREARHAKARTLLFDRPIEIEPIYEPRLSPADSPPPPPVYTRRRSMTPPDYYGMDGPPQPQSRRPPLPSSMPIQRGPSPPPNYPQPTRYSVGPPPMPPAPVPYGRYYLPPPHLPPPSPSYSSPPHEPYRPYNINPPPHSSHFPHGQPYHHSPYGSGSMVRERDRAINEAQLPRSPRHEPYYALDQRAYLPSIPPYHLSRNPAIAPGHHQHPTSPHIHHQSSSANRRTPPPPHVESPRFLSREFRREKLGENISNEPEEGRPSRVLFVTNIDSSQTESDLKEVFESFGLIEDIELKKISAETSSALLRFSSMDCAYRAKTAINGRCLGNSKCRISYGKVSASRRLWIGGLGPTTTTACLEDEFGKFGTIINLDYIPGRPYAYVEFESANNAQLATNHLRGTLVAQAERRIRIEYVDPVDRPDKSQKVDTGSQNTDVSSKSRTAHESCSNNEPESSMYSKNRKRSISPANQNSKRARETANSSHNFAEFETGDRDGLPTKRMLCRSLSKSPTNSKPTNYDNIELSKVGDPVDLAGSDTATNQELQCAELNQLLLERLSQSTNVREIVDCCSISWYSQLILRNFSFPSKMFLLSGRKATVEKYITKLNGENGDSCPKLRITQRWRLHPQPKLEEVKRRMQTGNLGMLIITSSSQQSPNLSSPTCKTPQSSTSQTSKQSGERETQGLDEKMQSTSESSVTQSRPLKNLISYLEQKDAAGVISLKALDRDPTSGPKLLYAFPPGNFALNLLKRRAPNMTPESTKEEFLLGVIVGVSESKI